MMVIGVVRWLVIGIIIHSTIGITVHSTIGITIHFTITNTIQSMITITRLHLLAPYPLTPPLSHTQSQPLFTPFDSFQT